MLRSLTTIALGILFTVIGLVAGWQLSAATAPSEDHHEHEEHDDHDHDEEHAELSEQTLKTLGVVVEHVHPRDHVRTVDVRARLVDRPENHRTVVAPLGGIVRRVMVESGQVVEAEAPLLHLVRDPIPLPGQDTALDIVLPERRHLLEGLASLRAARTDLEIARREIERLKTLGREGDARMPELFENRLVELGYDEARAARRVQNAEAELHHHGLDDAEIEEAAAGGHLPSLLLLWQRILRHHGAWSEREASILARLPETERDKPWPVMLLAELSLRGLVRPDLLDLVETQPQAAARFREVAGLLMEGYSIENVGLIARLGGLEADLLVRAPEVGGARTTHWDLARLLARVGLRVQAGDPVAELYDPHRLWMRLEPIGGEIAHVRRAVQEHLTCTAAPVLAGSAPALDAVRVSRLAPHGEQGTLAYAEIENEVLLQEGRRRSWSLQAGTEFLVRIPIETLQGRFVLPAEAVVRHGPDRIVYVLEEHDHDHHEGEEHHDDEHDDDDHHDDEHDDEHEDDDHHDEEEHHHEHFHAVPVHVELDGEDVVVIANDGALHAGDEVVVRGAFALHLALQRGSGDAEADHGHSHH